MVNRFLSLLLVTIIACSGISTMAFLTNREFNPADQLISIDQSQSLSEVTVRTLPEFYQHYYELTGKEWTGPRPAQTRGQIIYEAISTRKYIGGGDMVEIGCIIQIGVGQQSSWNRVYGGEYCDAVSSGNFTWKNLTGPKATLYSTSYNKKYVKFVGRGVAEVKTTTQYHTGLEAAVFSFSCSSGGEYYFRKTASVNATIYE